MVVTTETFASTRMDQSANMLVATVCVRHLEIASVRAGGRVQARHVGAVHQVPPLAISPAPGPRPSDLDGLGRQRRQGHKHDASDMLPRGKHPRRGVQKLVARRHLGAQAYRYRRVAHQLEYEGQ
eukprot:CAMPEP_0115387094 /NCGR_PEP_ID=MMETSP0271-20121206/8484_1 /TAXON_ID=71861 /ORGANISM="Scrippsiella trochoidea, Strain CCMP3099" /LENGTH=124 /DNA_ID=CAMNT_0002810545 /DNA_START=41 /DNA_END=415 /DNA_ORIENTATION=-